MVLNTMARSDDLALTLSCYWDRYGELRILSLVQTAPGWLPYFAGAICPGPYMNCETVTRTGVRIQQRRRWLHG